MKPCFKCGEVKPTTEFYRHPMMADGLLGKCKECTKMDVRENRILHLEERRAYDRSRERPPGHGQRKGARHRAIHPTYNAARLKVKRALTHGVLVRPETCERCGLSCKPHAHHDDHSQPLAVQWLCPVCHAARHRELGRLVGGSR